MTNEKQAKVLRKLLEIEKAPPMNGGGLFVKDDQLYFKRASNPVKNLYRKLKREKKRGW